MKLLGFDISRSKSVGPVDDRRGWYSIVREGFAGAWQQNVEIKVESVLAFHAVFSCMTLIASDIAKLRVKLVSQAAATGIWSETTKAAYTPVLRKPNAFQTRIQFWEGWILSKLSRGNTYVLKVRDGRGVVTSLIVLDPCRTKPLVSDGGDIFYQLGADNLAKIDGPVVVPAREIIHDRFNCLFHPLVGLSPIYANGLAATQGLRIQNNSASFFGNQSRPSGMLVAPGRISQETADELKANWQAYYGGKNAGKVAVLGDGMKYEAMSVSADDAQLIEQLKWTAEVVCSTFHVPAYKVGVGQLPANSNVQALNVEYYSQCLQSLIEAAELCLDEGLGIGEQYGLGTEFDVDNLLRMDSATQVDVAKKAQGILTLDEQRRRLDAGPVDGGATIYLQQQDHSLAAIAARDAQLIDQAREPTPSLAEDAQRTALALSAKTRRMLRIMDAAHA